MQPKLSTSPKLDPIGLDAVTCPPTRTRNRFAIELAVQFSEPGNQFRPATQRCALARGQRGQPTLTRTTLPVGIGFGIRNFANPTFHSRLFPDGVPVNDQRRARIDQQFASFAAASVGKKDKPAFVRVFEQHKPRARSASAIRRSQSNSFRQRNLRTFGFPPPKQEFCNRNAHRADCTRRTRQRQRRCAIDLSQSNGRLAR